MIHYDNCPLCKSSTIEEQFGVKDYTVSGETFPLYCCNICTGMFTQDVPSQQDIGPYYASQNYISHSDTQKGFINSLYHKVRSITLAAKRKLVCKLTKLNTGKILDVGCGTGAFLAEMKRGGWEVTGLEPDETARKNAAELNGVHPLPSDKIFTLPDHEYNAITMWHVLEHVHQLHEYLDQLKRLMADKGRLFIAVPNYTSFDASHYREFWAAYDTPRHLYHFSPEGMKRLVEQHGLEVIQVKPMWFDSFYVSMLSEEYKNGKSNILKAFWVGLMSNLKTLSDKERCSSLIYIIKKA